MKIAKIKEIFESIQGEGLNVGEYQLFIRFSGCNLNCCYCDTDHAEGADYDTKTLADIIEKSKADVVSFTGGEPLIWVDFLHELLSSYDLGKKIYLETNGTMYEEMEKIKNFVDFVAMDIKIKSATGEKDRFEDNEKFLNNSPKEKTFVKVVFDKNITGDEINSIIELSEGFPLILQPKMPMNMDLDFEKVFLEFHSKHKNTRLIPQVHKFLNIP